MPSKGKNGKLILSPDEIKFIKDNWTTKTNPELAAALGLKLTKCRDFLRELGLRRMEMEYWTPEQVVFLKKSFKTIGDVELSEIFEAEWPKNKPWTEKHIRKKRCYLNLHRTEKQVNDVRIRNTKSGRYNTVNQRWKTTGVTEVGQIKVWKSQSGLINLVVIKIDGGFVHYYRWLYIQHFGPLNSDQIVRVKLNVSKIGILDIDDLEIIDRAENSRRNAALRMKVPEELREVINLKARLKREINKQQKKQEDESNNN